MKHLMMTAAIAAMTAAAPAAAVTVTNGDFETRDFTGWTVTTDNEFTARVAVPFDDELGSYRAIFQGGGVSTLSQSLATVAGVQYQLRFLAGYDAPFSRSAAPVTPGQTRMVVTVAGSELDLNGDPDAGFTGYTLNFLGGPDTTLFFEIGAGPGRWQLDEVEVLTLQAGVPEPGSWAMMLAGFGAAGAALRRRRAPRVAFAA